MSKEIVLDTNSSHRFRSVHYVSETLSSQNENLTTYLKQMTATDIRKLNIPVCRFLSVTSPRCCHWLQEQFSHLKGRAVLHLPPPCPLFRQAFFKILDTKNKSSQWQNELLTVPPVRDTLGTRETLVFNTTLHIRNTLPDMWNFLAYPNPLPSSYNFRITLRGLVWKSRRNDPDADNCLVNNERTFISLQTARVYVCVQLQS
jgi:hypothetical protein